MVESSSSELSLSLPKMASRANATVRICNEATSIPVFSARTLSTAFSFGGVLKGGGGGFSIFEVDWPSYMADGG